MLVMWAAGYGKTRRAQKNQDKNSGSAALFFYVLFSNSFHESKTNSKII